MLLSVTARERREHLRFPLLTMLDVLLDPRLAVVDHGSVAWVSRDLRAWHRLILRVVVTTIVLSLLLYRGLTSVRQHPEQHMQREPVCIQILENGCPMPEHAVACKNAFFEARVDPLLSSLGILVASKQQHDMIIRVPGRVHGYESGAFDRKELSVTDMEKLAISFKDQIWIFLVAGLIA